ncbi:MAG: hypothetical protein VX726_13780 [Planctomycetota bacterium]|nr:hypothetical protein [Planctomycetota bacterium]
MKRTVTLAIVIVTGISLALVAWNGRRETARRAALLDGITSADPAVRAAAWSQVGPERDPAPLLARLLDAEAADPVLADAATAFEARDWPSESALVLASARMADPDPLLRAIREGDFRSWPERDLLAEGVVDLLADVPPPDDARILEAALAGLDEEDLVRLADGLARSEAGLPARDRGLLALAARVPVSIDEPGRDVASGLAAAMVDPTSPLSGLPSWSLASPLLEGRGALELEARAATGDPDAVRTLARLDARRVARAETTVLSRADAGFDRRLIAVGRLLGSDSPPGDAAVLNLLATGPADADDRVHGAASIAALGLSTTAREGVLRRWTTSPASADRRAAMILGAAMDRLGALPADDPVRLLVDRTARDPQTDAESRRVARLAARSLGAWPFEPSDLEAGTYAGRTRRRPDGRVDPDATMLGMLAGDAEAERFLLLQPDLDLDAGDFAREIAWRRLLAALWRPSWIDAVGEPVPGDEYALRLWIDAIAAARLGDASALSSQDSPGSRP